MSWIQHKGENSIGWPNWHIFFHWITKILLEKTFIFVLVAYLTVIICDFTTCTINDRCVLPQPLVYLSSPIVPQSRILNHLQCCQSWLVKVNLCEQCPGWPYLTPVKHWVVSSRTLSVRISRPTESIISRCHRAFPSCGLYVTGQRWVEGGCARTISNKCLPLGLSDFDMLLLWTLQPLRHVEWCPIKYTPYNICEAKILQILNKLYLV